MKTLTELQARVEELRGTLSRRSLKKEQIEKMFEEEQYGNLIFKRREVTYNKIEGQKRYEEKGNATEYINVTIDEYLTDMSIKKKSTVSMGYKHTKLCNLIPISVTYTENNIKTTIEYKLEMKE